MAGEPALATLDRSRLVSTTGDKISNEELDATLERMRAEVDVSFQSWHDEQPACWEGDREAYRDRKLREQGHARPVVRSAPYDMGRPILLGRDVADLSLTTGTP